MEQRNVVWLGSSNVWGDGFLDYSYLKAPLEWLYKSSGEFTSADEATAENGVVVREFVNDKTGEVIEKLYDRIVGRFANKKIIDPTTKEVIVDRNEMITEKLAEKIAEKYGFKINDLYALSAALPEEAHSDAVHYYTPEGTEAFTNQVLSFVAPELGINEALEYREEMYTDKPIGI